MSVNRLKRPFSPRELEISDEKFPMMPGHPGTNMFTPPISYRENIAELFGNKRPCFAVNGGSDFANVFCDFYQKKLGRCRPNQEEMIDAFGVKWIFEKAARGSISVAGRPRFEDVNDWKDVITMPDLDDWDWAADAAAHPVDTRYGVEMPIFNGFWFERLISLMDFINAAMALVDEDQYDALNELFGATTQLACDFVDKVCEYWPAVDGFCIHDDWGSQRAPFFSEEVGRKLFVPHYRKLADHIHSKGRYFSLHSCGCIGDHVKLFIEAGIDTWQMQPDNNDIADLYEKYGDQIILQVTIPAFDINDDKAAIKAAEDYVRDYCKPGKPTMFITRNIGGCHLFEEKVYELSRKHYLDM